MNPNPGLVVAFALCGIACCQDDEKRIRDLESVARSAVEPPSRRIGALSSLQGMAQLDAGVVAEALSDGDEHVAAAAAAILRHEWGDWPSEVVDAVSASRQAAVAVLRELALAPRPGLDALVVRLAQHSDPDVRALALAARLAPPVREEAEWLLGRCAGSDDRTASLAIQRIASADADQLVGALHALLLGGAPVERIGAFLDRMSQKGVDQLLGVASGLDASAASPLFDYLAQRRSSALGERIRAMVDGEIPMDPCLLRRAGAMLDTPERRARVYSCFEAATSAPADEGARRLALAAFEAAIDGKRMDAAVVAFAKAGGGQRLQMLARGDASAAAPAFGSDWEGAAMAGGQGLWLVVAKACAQRGAPLPADLDTQLRAFVDANAGVAKSRDEVRVAAESLARLSGEDVLPLLARAVADDPACARLVVLALVRRQDPVGAVMLHSLLADMQAADAASFASAADATEVVLLESKACGADDARCDGVFTRLGSADPAIVERLAAACPSLSDARWQQVLAAFGAANGRSKALLGRWISACPLDSALTTLRAAHAATLDQDDKLTLYECLLRTTDRRDLVERGMKAFGADADADDDFLFAALATMQQPLSQGDVALIEWAMFDAPGRDGRESKRAQDPRSRGVFPEVAAIANAILRDPANGARAFDGARARVAGAPGSGVSRRRFLELWAGLQRDAALLDRVGRATATFALALPAQDGEGEAAAALYAARDASSRGEHGKAESLFRSAIAGLLRDPGAESEARVHLGVRAPFEGEDAYAALAAAPALCRARAAKDPAAARAAVQLARELSGRDMATQREIDAILRTLR